MTDYKFEDLSKQTVAQLRKIAEGVEHEALQDPAKMPKGELLAALCQALGIEAGESPEESVQDKESAAQEDTATEPPEESAKEEPEAVQEDAATEPTEESTKEEPAAAQEDTATEPAEESAKEEPAAAQEDAATEPPMDVTPSSDVIKTLKSTLSRCKFRGDMNRRKSGEPLFKSDKTLPGYLPDRS